MAVPPEGVIWVKPDGTTEYMVGRGHRQSGSRRS